MIFDDFSSCGAKQSQNAFDKSCLASAVGSDDAEEIVLVDLQIDIVEHRASVIGGGESSDGEEGRKSLLPCRGFLSLSMNCLRLVISIRIHHGGFSPHLHLFFPVVRKGIDGDHPGTGLLRDDFGVSAVKFRLTKMTRTPSFYRDPSALSGGRATALPPSSILI